MKNLIGICIFSLVLAACESPQESVTTGTSDNPLFNQFNQPVDFSTIQADHVTQATESICLLEVVVIIVDPVRPVVTAEIVPQVLDGIEFRRVRWQRDDRDVRWNLQVFGTVEAGLVPDQNDMDAGVQFVGELFEEHIHHAGVDIR